MIKRHTFTLITRAANDLMANIHNDGENKNRMPLFLTRELSDKWLLGGSGGELATDTYKNILHFEMPAGAMAYQPVFTIRSPKSRPDDKPKNEFWERENLHALGQLNP